MIKFKPYMATLLGLVAVEILVLVSPPSFLYAFLATTGNK